MTYHASEMIISLIVYAFSMKYVLAGLNCDKFCFFSFILLAELFTDEEGEETRAP